MLYVVVLAGIVCGVCPLRIAPEIPVDFSIHLCTHHRRLAHGHMQLNRFHADISDQLMPMSRLSADRYCVTMRSSKTQRDLAKDRQGTTSISSSVLFTWRQVTSARRCRVGFQGYQGEYRLSPDFGAYEECQYILSRHAHALSEVLARGGPLSKTLRFNVSDPICPFISLPTTYADYVSCSLNANEWYILDWQSSIRYETYHSGNYGSYYANHTTSFVFQPSDNLLRNGTEKEWLARLVHLETRTNDCDASSLLVRFDEYWPFTSAVVVYYYIKDGHRIIYERQLVTASVERWLQQDFSLQPKPGVHEVCAQIIGQPELRQRVCRVVVDRLECPFPMASTATAPVFSVFCLLALCVISR